MKNIFNAIAVIVFAAGLMSCSGFLDEKVTTSFAGDGLIASEEALDMNILGCYAQLRTTVAHSNCVETWDPGSAVLHWGLAYSTTIKNAQERWTSCLKFTNYSKHPQSYTRFGNFNKTIYRCNLLLEKLPQSPVDEAYKKQIEGEAYFIRAFCYYSLVRQYADVPMLLEAPHELSAIYKERSNFWDVYVQVIKDLEKAEGLLDDFQTMNSKYTNSDGRVCNYAATAMKSSVYLTIGTLLQHPDDNFWVNRTPDFSAIGITSAADAFNKALTTAEEVMQNGPFKLCPSFQQLFRWTEPEDWQLKERIFVLPQTNEGGNLNMAGWSLPTYYNNASKTNGGRMRPSRWLFQKWCETYGGDKGTPGQSNENIYINCKDPRFDVTFIYDYYLGQNLKKTTIYPNAARVKITANSTSTQQPYFRKYYSPDYSGTTGSADCYMMRYAEIYLIAAEAAANLCENPADTYGMKAIDYVNVILKRARESTTMDGTGTPSEEPANWTAAKYPTKDELLLAIFWERCFELDFEFHEWYDTHRMGANWIVENISKPKNAFLRLPEQQDLTFGANGYFTYWYGGNYYDEDQALVRKGLILAFPNDELLYNTALDLNKYDPNKGQNPQEVFWR